MLGRKKTIFAGSCIMVVGAAIQCSSFSLGQLIASRFITGFGNGNYIFQRINRSLLILVRYEYFDSTNMAIRDFKIASSRPNGDDRRNPYCVWRHDLILDRSWILFPGTLNYHLAISDRLPDRPGTHHRHLHSRTARITTLVSTQYAIPALTSDVIFVRDNVFTAKIRFRYSLR